MCYGNIVSINHQNDNDDYCTFTDLVDLKISIDDFDILCIIDKVPDENELQKRQEFVCSNGLTKTTKKHEDIHGFGLKSVKRICEKYDGTLDICPENNFFNVNILFKNTQPNSKK